MTISSLTAIPMTTILLGVALLQWVVVVVIGMVRRVPKSLVASSIIAAVGIVNAFGVRHDKAVSKAAALPQAAAAGSCASIEPGMVAATVRDNMGPPPEVRDDSKTRGPGATTWVYRDSRCAVHFLDEKVELVE